ncbi:MAG: hypothetical protein CTY27_04190 [Methylotenera sp.]|nr:MAG: hypothetical protein CTY27_04190 [Methylotenera sp.]
MQILIGMVAIIAVIMGLTTYFLVKQQKAKLNPAQRLYAQYLNQLKRAGLSQNNGETALDFATRAAKILPNQQTQIMDIAQRYNVITYSKLANPELLQALADCIKQLNIPKK